MNLKHLFVVLAFALLWAQGSGTQVQANAPSHSTKTFTFRLLSEPETLDWNRAHTPIETHLLSQLMEGLVSLDSKGADAKPVPALAQSWKISADRKTYVFHLRPGVLWSDGVPLKAQDFVYGWKRLLTPSTAAAYAYFLFDIRGAKDYYEGKTSDFTKVGIKALDDSHIQVVLQQPIPYWIYIPSFWVTYPMREDAVKKVGTGAWDVPGKMITLGPYLLIAHELESKYILKANPRYYGKRGNLEQIIGLIVKEDSTALKLYEAGKLDFLTDIPSLDLKRFQGRPDLKTFRYLKTGYLGFVTDKLPGSNLKFRRAVAMAIDKSKLSQLLQGGQEPATSFVPPPLMGYSKTLGLPYQPDQARRELQLSGLASGPNSGKPVSINFVIPHAEKTLTVAQFIQNELKKNLGIEVMIESFDYKTYRSHLDLRTYPMFLTSWSGDYPDADNFLSVFLSQSGNNRTQWKSPSYDQGVEKGRYLPSPSERQKLYSKIQKILLEKDGVVVPLYYEPNPVLLSPRVKNLELNVVNGLDLRKVELGP